MMLKAVAFACLAVLCGVPCFGADWPQWGGTDGRNMASDEKGLADTFQPPKRDPKTREYDLSTGRNVKWVAKLGTQTYGNPTVANGRIFVGTNSAGRERGNGKGQRGGGEVLCFEEATGKLLWHLSIPRFVTDLRAFNYDDMGLGVCASPTVEGDRVYLTGSRGEILCLDVKGLANGNDGPFTNEAQFVAGDGNPPAKLTDTDGDIIWCYDTIKELPCWPQDASDCSVVIHGDLVYMTSSNGVDRSHVKVPYPDAPSFIALDKKTGKLVAADTELIGRRLFHGQWSNPCKGIVNGKTQIIWGGGDGLCYGFDPTPLPSADGKLAALKTLWSADCNMPGRRLGPDGKPLKYRAKLGNRGAGPSEIIATPVFYNDRVYVAVGQDPRHGKGVGNLVCIDPSKTGDITTSGRVWTYDAIDRTLSTVSIADGLLFVSDFSGVIHCLDLATGKPYWTHNTESPIWGSTYVADGRVYLGTEDGDLWVFAATKEKKHLATIRFDNKIYTTPIVANGVLYVATQTHLYAIAKPK